MSKECRKWIVNWLLRGEAIELDGEYLAIRTINGLKKSKFTLEDLTEEAT